MHILAPNFFAYRVDVLTFLFLSFFNCYMVFWLLRAFCEAMMCLDWPSCGKKSVVPFDRC